MKDIHYIKSLIAQGEGLHLDFKFNISNASKIAKSLVAFANTEGGKLLVGVKDNGRVVGVSSDEEKYMIELAAYKYCHPEVMIEFTDIIYEDKTILEVYVQKSDTKPHSAKDEMGKWSVYFRKADENILANKIFEEAMKKRAKYQRITLTLGDAEKALIDYLEKNPKITIEKFCEIAKIKLQLAEKILINLVAVNMVKIEFTPTHEYYYLGKN